MRSNNLLILTGDEVLSLLAGRERDVLGAVRRAYEGFGRGLGSLPHSTFLRFPADDRSRIIALPAFLGDGFGVAGIKWIASFPGNHDRGLDRASAVLVLNSTETGRPEAMLESSVISARRTAASAALAAQTLRGPGEVSRAGLVGCGPINFEVVRFLTAAMPEIRHLVVYDLHPERAEQFKVRCERSFEGLEVSAAGAAREAFEGMPLVSLATTALRPHIEDLSACAPGSTVLHVSLRDFTPEAVLAADNVVDDVDHVCRAGTSVHLASELSGNRDFIRCTLADVLLGRAPARRSDDGVTIFSPFGLGVLDLAVGKLVYDLAVERRLGTVIPAFLPGPWAGAQ
jgi:2,3-diaminopropionate biosynthesis protein SbnB